MLKSLYVDNYKSLVNFNINFDSFNLLIGKNGSGKSSVFEVIKNIQALVNNHVPVELLFHPETLTKWQDSSIQVFEISFVEALGDYKYRLEVDYNLSEAKVRIRSEKVWLSDNLIFESELGKVKLYNDRFESGAEINLDWQYSGVGMINARKDNRYLIHFKELMAKIIVCAPKPFCMTSKANKELKYIDYNAKDIASVLRYYAQDNPETITELKGSLQDITPTLKSIYLKGDSQEKVLYFDYEINGNRLQLSFDALSDGEKQLITLYALIHIYIKNGGIILIDEPDNYVSLEEIQPWCAELEEYLEENGQCIIISHNAEIIDYMAVGGCVWMERISYRASRVIDPPTIQEPWSYSEIIRQREVGNDNQ